MANAFSGELCFGGSFNPVHIGHLVTARAAAEAGGFDRVRLIPTGTSPFKAGQRKPVSDEDRLAVLDAAVADDPMFVVDPVELGRPGKSFTADTAEQLRGSPPFSGRPIPWLIGADLLPTLDRWHRADELLAGDLVRFIVMHRAGYPIDWDPLPPAVQKLQSDAVVVPDIEISSSDIRDRLSRGRSVRYLVPDEVLSVIERLCLYRDVD